MSDHPHQKLITTVFAFTTEKGAITQLYAATAEEAGNYGGKFLVPLARVGKPRAESDDIQLGRDLWTWLEEQIQDI